MQQRAQQSDHAIDEAPEINGNNVLSCPYFISVRPIQNELYMRALTFSAASFVSRDVVIHFLKKLGNTESQNVLSVFQGRPGPKGFF